MRITVETDFGVQVFDYDTDPNSGRLCFCPGHDERPLVVAALANAITFLSPSLHGDPTASFKIVAAVDATGNPSPPERRSHLRVVDPT